MRRTFLLLLTLVCVGEMSSAVSPQERPRSKSPSRSGAITGRVMTDAGHPLPHVSIMISRIGANPPSTRGVTTGEDGRFTVSDLPTGTYNVTAFARGYVEIEQPDPRPRRVRPGQSVDFTMIKGGVIAGTVTSSAGEPLVTIRVQAIRVKDSDGRPVRDGTTRERTTDDRGVYRLYALKPGRYVVVANRASGFGMRAAAGYEGEAPTYYPSSTRDAATELTLRNGDELSGIDIRYRGERGYAVSGRIIVAQGALKPELNSFGISIGLRSASTGNTEASAGTSFQDSTRAFAFYGVPPGEYELAARVGIGENAIGSLPRRVTVKGSDVTGLELTLGPLGSIAGRVSVESAPEALRKACLDKRNPALEEIVINARVDRRTQDGKAASASTLGAEGASNEQGIFVVSGLYPGSYRLEAVLPTEDWYLRSVTRSSSTSDTASSRQPTADATTIGISSGNRVTGINVAVYEGGASLRGRVSAGNQNTTLPRLRLHLIPAEKEDADDPMRFYETDVASDGSFALTSIAPGRYWVFARTPVDDPVDLTPRPLAWDPAERKKTLAQAEAAGSAVELQPCQRITNHVFRYTPPAPVQSQQ